SIPLAWFTGALLSMLHIEPDVLVLSSITAALFLMIGGVLAGNLRVSLATAIGLGFPLGLWRGMADLTGGPISGAALLMVLGMCVCAFVVFALAASVTLPLTRMWTIVAVRVCGSWIAALGLLLAGWIMRYGTVVR